DEEVGQPGPGARHARATADMRARSRPTPAGRSAAARAKPGPASQYAHAPATNQRYGPKAPLGETVPEVPMISIAISGADAAASQMRISESRMRRRRKTDRPISMRMKAVQSINPGAPNSSTRKLY